MLTAISVYGVVALAGWLCLPLLARLFPHTADHGAGAGRALLLFLAGWLAWLLAAGGLGAASFALATGLIVLVGALAWLRWWQPTLAWARAHWRRLLALELLGLGVYAVLLVYRGFSADITTFEKYTNLAIVNSILLVPQVPPQNAWFGGEPLNYYYLGHWTLALLARVSGLPANDLVIFSTPLLAAVCAQACVTIVATLCPRHALRWTALAVFLLLACGSFNETVHGLTDWPAEWQRPYFESRIPNPVVDDLAPYGNLFEMPAVALVQGEFHAHVLGIPLMLAVLALLAQYSVTEQASPAPAWLAVCAVLVGLSYAVNSWQYPVLVGLCVLVIGWQAWRHPPPTRRAALACWLAPPLLIGGSILAVLPFWLTFETFSTPLLPDSGLQPVPLLPGELLAWSPVGTTFAGFALSTGLPFLLAGAAALALLRGPGWRWLVAGGVLGLLSVWYRPIGLVLLPLAAAGLWLALARRAQAPGAAFGGLLLVSAALLVLGCDYVMIPDHTFSRSNTLFKFYLQVWVLLAIAAPLLLSAALQPAAARLWLRPALAGLLVVVVLSGSVLPVLRGRQWVRYHGDRWWGLDGMAQLRHYHPDEAAAIDWLRQQPGSGGVLETIASSTDGLDDRLRPARFSALTGRPTPRGWSGHTAQWSNYRANPQVRARFENTGAMVLGFPSTGDINEVYALMAMFNLEYVAFGQFEAREWGAAGRALLAEHLPLRWQSGAVAIFGRPADFPPALVWLHPQDWSNREVTTDGTATPFHWMHAQQGQISLYSERRAIARLTFAPINSTEPGEVSLWHAERELLRLPVLPYQPQSRVLWLPVEAGVTTLEVRTNVAPVQEPARSVTIAIRPPQVTLLRTSD